MMPSEMHITRGLEFIQQRTSLTGRPLFIAGHEMTGTVDLYEANNLTFIRQGEDVLALSLSFVC